MRYYIITCLTITSFLSSCGWPGARNIIASKKIAKDVYEGQGLCWNVDDPIYYTHKGFWLMKGWCHIYENENDSTQKGLLLLEDPISIVNDSNFILAKNQSKYVIIKLRNDSFDDIYFARDTGKYESIRGKLKVPESLQLN